MSEVAESRAETIVFERDFRLWKLDVATRGDAFHRSAPVGRTGFGFPLPRLVGAPSAEHLRQRFEPETGVADQLDAAPLERIEGVNIQAHELRLGKQGMRAGHEILESRSDREDDVRAVGERVRSVRSGDADCALLQRMVPGECAFSRLSLGDRYAVRLGKCA